MDKDNKKYDSTGSRSTVDENEHDPISEDDYYSEDFEQDDEVVEVIQEIEIPQQDNHPSPRRREVEEDEAPSEEEDAILVFKSTTGPRLTIQPRKIANKNESARLQHRTNSDINVRAVANKLFSNVLQQKNSNNNNNRGQARAQWVKNQEQQGNGVPRIIPMRGAQQQQQQKQATDIVLAHVKSEDSMFNQQIVSRKSSQIVIGMSPRVRQLIQASTSTSSCRRGAKTSGGNKPYNYRVTTTTICTGPLSGNRKVPGSTNITNRNYTREKRLVAAPYLSGYHPPMRLGPGKVGGNVAQRVASAKRITINDLKNRISVLIKESEDLRKENRCLKVCQNRQSLALRKWEGRDAELPKLLQQHKDEIKATQIQLKKSMYQCRELEEKMRFKDRKLTKMESDLQLLKTLATKDNLKERNDLQEQVDILSGNVAGCEKKIRQYMRHIEIMENNHKHQISAEKQKLIKANNHALELRHEITGLKISLRDKDRMLNYIQMRSTGRNLMKAFQEKEKIHSAKLNPAMSHPFMTSSPRSRSVSPKASHNLGSGRSYRSHSMDRCTEIRPRTCHQSRRESVHNSSRDTHNNNQNETNLPYHNDLPPRDQMNQGDQSSGRRSTFTPRDEYPKNSGGEIGDVMSPHDGQAIPQRQSHVAVEPEVVVPARTDYFKISKMLGQSRVKPPVEQSPSPNLPPPPSEKVQNSQNSEKLITTQKPKIILPVSEIPPNTTPEPEKLEKKVLVQHHHHAQAPEYVVPFTTGPKTHSDAKKEMKLKRQESELVACAKAKAHIDDAKKQKWEKVVQHQTRPSLTAKKVPSSSQKSGSIATHKTSSNPNNSNNKYTETTVKVRSPIGKNQVKSFNNQNNRKQHNQSSDSYHHHYNSNNTLRKDDSSGTVEVCVQIKKNSTSYQKQKKQEVVSSDEYSPNVSDDDTEEFEQLEKKVASQSLIYVDDSPKVPPPPRNFQIHNPPQSSHDLSPRERAEIKDNERVMVDFLKKNSHKLGTERVVQSFSTPMFPNCQVQPQQFASTANIIGGHEGGYRHEFFPTEAPAPNSGGYPSSINTGTGTILLAGLPIPNKSEYMHHSPRSEPSIGPGREHVFNHQFPQYQPQSVSASARPTINRGTSSHPQIQAPSQYQNYQVQGTYSIPSVMGQEQFSNCRPDTRCIFSYSNPHSSSQPINLPYYGMPGDGPSQQGIGSYHSSPSYSPQMPPVKRPPSQRRPNQKGKPTDKEISHYDPSFFTKLGTWK